MDLTLQQEILIIDTLLRGSGTSSALGPLVLCSNPSMNVTLGLKPSNLQRNQKISPFSLWTAAAGGLYGPLGSVSCSIC